MVLVGMGRRSSAREHIMNPGSYQVENPRHYIEAQ